MCDKHDFSSWDKWIDIMTISQQWLPKRFCERLFEPEDEAIFEQNIFKDEYMRGLSHILQSREFCKNYFIEYEKHFLLCSELYKKRTNYSMIKCAHHMNTLM